MNKLKFEKEIEHKRLMSFFLLKMHINRWIKRKAKNREKRLTNCIRNVICTTTSMTSDSMQDRAKQKFLWFIEETASLH